MTLAGAKNNITYSGFPIEDIQPASWYPLSRVSVGFEPTFPSSNAGRPIQLDDNTLFFLVVSPRFELGCPAV